MELFRSVNLSNVADEEQDVFLYCHLFSVKAFPISISSRYPEKNILSAGQEYVLHLQTWLE